MRGCHSTQHAAYSMQRAKCSVQNATCNVQCVACSVQHAACKMQHATRNGQRAMCSMQRAACKVQHTTCRIQHAACNVQPPLRLNHTCRSTPKSGGARQSRLTTTTAVLRPAAPRLRAWAMAVAGLSCLPSRASQLASTAAHGTGCCAGLSRALIASQLRTVRCRSRRRAAADGRAHRAVQGHEKLARHVHAGEHRC
jgi:hypothetical protein